MKLILKETDKKLKAQKKNRGQSAIGMNAAFHIKIPKELQAQPRSLDMGQVDAHKTH